MRLLFPSIILVLVACANAASPHKEIVTFTITNDAGSGNSDYDIYIYKNPRADCSPNDCTVTDGSQAADYQSACRLPTCPTEGKECRNSRWD